MKRKVAIQKEKNIELNKKIEIKSVFKKRGFKLQNLKEKLSVALKKDKEKLKKLLKIILIIATVFTATAFIAKSIFPYKILVNGETACYVRNWDSVGKTINGIAETYIPEGTVVKAIDFDGAIQYERVKKPIIANKKMLSVKEATQLLIETIKDKKIEITIAAAKTKIVSYTPEPNYLKDDEMLAGEMRVKIEGKDGKQKETTTYTIVNGKVVSKKITAREVIEEGKKATVYKGTLGLPEGEDWRTYEGLPEFKDGKELIITAAKYLGAPYKYGGYSFKTGIDCVQFVRAIYKMYGINLPNGKHGLKSVGKSVSLKEIQKGDIVCYNRHYGIYVGDGKIINATRKRGVAYSSVHTQKIVTIRRVVK